MYKGVIIRFVAETQMASATSLLDRTDMYNMVAQEGISNPETDTGLPTLQEIVEPVKLSRPIYLGDKPITSRHSQNGDTCRLLGGCTCFACVPGAQMVFVRWMVTATAPNPDIVFTNSRSVTLQFDCQICYY